ncbi:oligopeptide ABC transporter substrate-binding protein [Rummeliibacillus sp. SL167]|uniref:oligopeptide ABC transporter substrate-binding protein n=1 Tax=Rummeliibacillus sp. SL167 TaxID=2579792 RepID=UPI0011B7892D|nr:oligopeptide ABC transporter substrate-binding protein [Rummeliibacillus sp. SL167]
MKKKSWFLLTVLASLLLVLVACGGGDKDKKESEEKEKVDTSKLAVDVKNDGTPIKGGILKVGLQLDAPFKGMFLYELYQDAYDAEILAYTSNSLFDTKEDFLIDDTGLGKLKVDEKANKATITIQKNVKWSDGKPLTADDVIYPYLIIGHKDYTGVRYDADFQNIVGAKEYHDGNAKDISGIKKIDDYTVEISFKKISPAIYSGGDGLWGYAAPYHQLKDIPIKDLQKSDAVRKTPVTLGAFVIDKIVKGESVELVANKNYWKGKPKIDKVVISVVSSATAPEALKTGKFDLLAPNYPSNDYNTIKDYKNITVLGRPELAYSYLGFKEGKWDSKKSEVVVDSNAKMADKKLRQAIAYGMDIETVANEYYDGLRSRANSLIPPVFATYYDSSLKGYNYDPEKAKKLLDEAGYKDTNNDGFREDQNGKAFTIKLAGMSGSDKDNKIAQYYIQNWKDIGLKVELTTGRLIEFNSFYDKVDADNKDIDMFMAAWGTGTNPSPIGLYSKYASFNYSRYTTPELEEQLNAIDSKEALDPDYRAQAFKKWQETMKEEAVTVPMYFRTEIIPVNKRVKKFSIDYVNGTELQDIELTADEPIKE